MRKSLKYILLSAALILCVVLGVKGYILQVASGTWAAQASLTQARSGASAVLMQDGRILVTGGDGAAGTLASAEMIGLDGTSSAAASMSTTRSKHVSAVLANGSVLVAGGTTSGGGAINTAEIYDPVANSWTTVAGAMIEARSNATATVLQDGRVLIAGGDRSGVASSTIEIFDPVALTFSFAGALASPRTDHAMALLSDGRVFIAGGSNGSAALNTTDIYDPVAGTVGVGPALSALRMGHSAITMLDGRVLIAGGNNGTADLATAEIFDPVAGTVTAVASSLSTARQGHLAFLLPNNNTVLIVGGTSASVPLASAEVFTPWLGTFAPTGSLTVARNNSAGSPMKQDGLLVVAGGQDGSGVALANTDIYGFATVKTDAADYPPGTTVNITGSGWQPGETVTLTLVESPLIDTHGPFTVVADANGNISNSSFVTDDHDLSIRFYLTAVGSQAQAQNTFKDNKMLAINFAGNGAGTVGVSDTTTPGDNTTCTGSPNPCDVTTGNFDVGTLTATAAAGSVFSGWSAQSAGVTGCTGSTCNFSMGNTGQSVAVTFKLNRLAITSVNGGSNAIAGTPFSVVVQSQDGNGNPLNVTSNTGVSLSRNAGTGTLGGTLTGTITAGTNSVTISGVTYTKAESGVVLTATRTSGDTLAAGNSTAFTVVAGTATKLALSGTTTSLASGTTRVLTATTQDVNGNTVTSGADSTLGVTFAQTTGTGSVSGLGSSTAVAGVATLTVTGNLPGSVTITATATGSSGALTAGTGNPITFTVVTGTATKLALSGATTSLASGTTRVLTATIQDVNGNTITTGADSTLSVTFAQTAGAGSATGLGSSMSAAGVATLTVTGNVAGSVTITATATGSSGALTAGTGNPITFTVVTGTATKLALSGATTNLASGTTRVLTATIQDAGGNTVTTGADSTLSVTFAKATGAGSVTGLGSSTAGAGVATLTVTGNLAGSVTITATATGSGGALAAGTGNPITFTVVTGTATKLALSGATTSLASGTTRVLTATIQDANGNTITTGADSTLSVTFAKTAGAGSVTGLGSSTAGAGVATLTVTGNLAGSVTITATATGSSGALAAGTGNPITFTVVTGTATTVQVETAADGSGTIVPAQNVTTGSAVTGFAISRDAAGNFIANVAATWSLTNVTGGVVAGDLVPAVDTKSATFTGHKVGTANVHAAVSGLTSADSGKLTVVAGTATSVLVETAANGTGTVVPAQNVTAGNAITVFAIARDASNNFVANVAADSWSLVNATGGVVSGDLVPVVGNKSAVFTGHLAGTAAIRATSGSLASTNSGIITVVAGTGTKLAFGQQPTDVVAGASIAPAVTVLLEDPSGNVVTGDSGTPLQLVIGNNAGNGTLSPTNPSVMTLNGVATFSNLSINKTGVGYTLVAQHGTLTSTTSNSFTVNPGAVSATTSTISGTTPVTANGTSTSAITITLKDANSNAVPGVIPTFSASGSNNTYGVCSTSSATGVSNCTLASTTAETKTLSIVTPVVVTGGTVTFNAGVPVAANSTISGTSGITANGIATSTITITLKDTNANPVPGVIPTFSATGTNNTYGACSVSSTAGVSICSLASTKAETKTLSIATPVVVMGGTVTFTAGALASLSLSPSSAMISAGGTETYTATGFDSNSNGLGDVTGATTFSITPDGSCNGAICTASVAGPHTVTGTDSGKTGTATLQVNAGTITSLFLTPQTMTIAAGASQTYAAQGLDSFNNSAGDVTAGTTFTITPDGSCTGAVCTANIAGAHAVTGTYSTGAKGGAALTVSAGTYTKLQVLVPGEAAAPGTTNGKTGTPSLEYVNGAFNVTVNAVDDNWNVVGSVNDAVQITSSDRDPNVKLPANAALVAGTGTFSVTLETVANPAATTITASDTTNTGIAAGTSAAMEVIVVYTASITPATAANAVDTAYTLTVVNAHGQNTNNLKSVTVAIPANGGVPTGVTVAATSSATMTPANWMVDTNPPSGFLRFRECVNGDGCYVSGNNDVSPGGNITIQFTTKANETINNAAVNEVWTTTAFSDAAYTTALPLAGAEPTVSIGAGAAITSPNSTTFTNGMAGSFTVTTSGFPIPTLTMTSGALPHGVAFTDKGDGTATIAGTTQAAGDFQVTITAHNGYGADATQTFTLTVTKANPTTAVMSSNLSSFSGQPVTFTATVVPGNSTAPTGTVQFQDGGINLGSAVALTSSGSVYSAQLQTSSLSVGTHSITAIYSGDTNFFTSTSAAISQVVKSAVTTTSISAPAITYGADGVVTVTVAADPAAGTPTGNVTLTVDGGSPVSQRLGNGSATFTISKPGAGDHALSANFAAQNNFLASTATGTLTVNTVAITVTADAQTKVYGDNDPALTYKVTTGVLVTGDRFTGALSRAIGESVGSYAINQGTLALSSNYILTFVSANLTITARPITVTADPETKVFGSVDPSPLTYKVTGPLVSGDAFTGALIRAPGPDVGTYPITQGTLTLSANYTLAFVGANFTITPATPAVAATGGTFAYNGNAETGTGAAVGVLGEVLPVTLTYFDASNNALISAPVNAGNYTVVAVYGGSLNYKATLSAPAAIVINAIPLFIEANYKTRAANTPDPMFDATYVGFINGETPQSPSLSGPLNCGSTASLNSPGGRYVINCTGVTSADYNITYVPGVLVITNPIISIAVNPGNPSVPVFSSQAFTATGTFADGTSRSLTSGGGAWSSVTAMPTPVSGAAVGLINGMIYVAGGSNGGAATDSTEAYDITNNTWTAKHDMLAARSGSSSTNGAVINGKLYVVGGSASGGCSSANEVYDPASDSWSTLTAMPTPRCDLAVVAANGHLYAIGGTNNGGSTQYSTVESYDPATNAWTTKAPLPSGLTALSATVVNGKIYVMGGWSSSGYANTNEVYDPSSDSWTAKSNMPSARSGLSSGAVDGVIYAIGGQDSTGSLSTVEAYNPLSDSWTTKTAVPQAIESAGVVSANDVLYVAGGIVSGTAVASLQTYTPDDISWASGTTSVSTIDSTGNAAALVPGTSTITAASLTIPTVQGNTLLTVIQATPVLSALTSPTIGYGTPSTVLSGKLTLGTHIPTGSVSITVSGVTQSAAIAGADGSFTSTFTTNSFGVTGSPYTITYSYAGDTLFASATDTTKTLTVTPASMTVTASSASVKYAAAVPVITASYSGFVNGETAANLNTPPTCTTLAHGSPNASPVGTYATNCAGAVDSNYVISYTPGTVTITAVPLNITASSTTANYGAAVPAITPSYSGLVNGDTAASLGTVTCTTAAHGPPSGSPVGSYASNCSGAVNSNYVISYTPGTVTITAVPLSITASSTTANYGAAVPAITPSYSGLVNGDTAASLGTVTCTTAAHGPPSGSPVGSYATNCSGAVNSNYVISYTPGTVTITAVPLNITASSTTANYSAAVPAITPSYSGLVNGDTAASLGTVTCTTAAHGPPSGSPVGSYASNCSGAVNSNYVISYTPGTVTITAVPLSITASSTTANYGAAVPAITASYIGFVNGDTSSSLTTAPTCTTAAHGPPSGSPVGSYATNCSGAVNNNYVVSYTPGTVTITAVPLSITASSTTANYGVAVPAITASYIGFVNGDTSSSLTTAPTCTTAAHGPPSGSPVGSYATNCSGAVNNNYVVSYTPGTVTITAVPLSITASSGAMIYGGPVFMVAPIYSGFVNGDTSASLSTAASCGTQATSLSPVGAYVSACSGAADGNYMITYLNGMVTVMPATTTTAVVSSSPNNTSTYMQLVTFTATVVPQYAGTTPTGTVTFYNNGSSIGTGTLSSSWCGTPPCADQAAFNISSLPDSGPDNITAVYGGDGNFVTSTSPAIIQTVLPAPNVSLSPMSLSFGNQNVNTTSRPAAVVLTNIGDATLNINVSGITISPNTDFAQTNNCGASVLPTKSCTISITFSPVDTGIRTAVLQITDNDDDASGAQQTVALTGSGLSTIPGTSLFTDAVFATANGCGSIVMSGGSTVDSFNSSQGYASSHTPSGGNVGTNGNVTLNGSKSAIYGSVAASSGSTGNCSKTSVTGVTTNGGAQVTGSVTAVNASISYPNPPAPNPAPPTTTQNISGSCGSVAGCSNTGSKAVSLMPGQYGNLTINGGTTAHFSHGTYNVNSLTLSGQSILLVDSGPIVINLAGASLSGGNPAMDATGGTIQNPTLTAENLQITYSGSRGLNLSGGTASYATVYAPNALVNMSGGTDFLGSIIASTVTNSGGTAIHYDSSLPAIASGNYIWFDAIANTVGGLPSNGAQVKLYLTNSSISFTANGTAYTVPVPNAVVTFNSASQTTGAKTSYDPVNSRWGTAVAKSGLTGNTFVTGVAFQLPANFPTGIQNVTWSASYSTDTPGITLQWQWGAAVYSAFSSVYATTNPMNNNVLGVNPEDGTAGSDLAGTPENYKASVIFGATGGGGTNYTGYFSAAAGVVPTVAPMSVSPSSLDFGAQTQGSTSGAMTVTLTNNDSAAHIISSITPTGANASDFAVTNTCPIKPISLGTGSSCTITVIFTPGDVGTRTAKVGVNDDANNTPQTVYLSGAGQ